MVAVVHLANPAVTSSKNNASTTCVDIGIKIEIIIVALCLLPVWEPSLFRWFL